MNPNQDKPRRPRMILTLLLGIPAPKKVVQKNARNVASPVLKRKTTFRLTDGVFEAEEKKHVHALDARKSMLSRKSIKSVRRLSKRIENESRLSRVSLIWRAKARDIENPRIYWPLTDSKDMFTISYIPFRGERIAIQIVVCGKYAKVINKGRIKVVKVICEQATCWIPFTILHQCSSDQSPFNVLRHEIEFDVKSGNETSREAEYYYEYPNTQVPEDPFPQMVRMFNVDVIPSKPEREVTWDDASPGKLVGPVLLIHRPQVMKTIKRSSHFIRPGHHTKSVLKNKSLKAADSVSRKSEIKPDDNEDYPKIIIKGEEIIYEKPVWAAEMDNSGKYGIHHMAVFLTSSDTLPPQNRIQLRPFSIFIRSLYKLPLATLEELRIQKIMVQYSYPPICDAIQIGPINVSNWDKVKVNSLRTFFYPDDKDDTIIIEALQFKQLKVKVYGYRETSIVRERGAVFGEGLHDEKFAERVHKKINRKLYDKLLKDTRINTAQKKQMTSEILGGLEMIPLCFAKISLEDLIEYTTYRMQKIVPLQSTLESAGNDKYNKSLKPIIIAKIHENTRITENGALSEKDLIEAGSYIKIEIKTGCSYKKNFLSKTLQSFPAYSRFFIIYKDVPLAYAQLKKLFQYNSSCNLPNSDGLPNTIFQNLTFDEIVGTKKFLLEKIALRERIRSSTGSSTAEQELDIENKSESLQYYVTGFMVDCIHSCILMMEAPVSHTVPVIMTDNFELERKSGRLLYNSDLIFNERIYDEFTMFGGLYLAILGQPLQSALQSNWIAMKNLIPEPAVRCIETLEKVMCARKISNDLFPTPQELLSCDFEFGVPLRKTRNLGYNNAFLLPFHNTD